MAQQPKHIFFDNDGTIVDSEIIAQRAMLDLLAAHGFHMSDQEYSHQFPGLLVRDILHLLQTKHGFQIPEGFVDKFRAEHTQGFNDSLRVIPGMSTVFRNLKVPKSMVSNGSIRHVEQCLKKVRLFSALDGQIFSADQVKQPKPFPDVYLYALDKTNVYGHQALVVEDSPIGVKAAKAAGILTIGFLGAAHIHDGHELKLREAGADFIAQDGKALGKLFEGMGLV